MGRKYVGTIFSNDGVPWRGSGFKFSSSSSVNFSDLTLILKSNGLTHALVIHLKGTSKRWRKNEQSITFWYIQMQNNIFMREKLNVVLCSFDVLPFEGMEQNKKVKYLYIAENSRMQQKLLSTSLSYEISDILYELKEKII